VMKMMYWFKGIFYIIKFIIVKVIKLKINYIYSDVYLNLNFKLIFSKLKILK
jgi:hypothetical protein